MLHRKWQNEFVFYNTGSGDTHVLDELSGEILKHIEKQPSTLEQISAELGLSPDTVAYSHIQRIISQLSDAFLIEMARP